MRRKHRLMAAAAAVVLAMGLGGCASLPDPGPTPDGSDVRTGRDPAASFTVTSADLGIHSFTTRPEVPTGSIRLNCYPGWSTVSPTQGTFDWVEFDRIVAQAEAWGYQDIVYVFCSTPAWAGQPVTGPDLAVFGPGSAQAPADMATFRTYVEAVVERYRGRIDGYETWNEPSSEQFFTGTPQQMGEMTQIVSEAVDALDPSAFVLSAGFQTHLPDIYDRFIPEYFADLMAREWPVDVVSAHFYPVMEGTPATRSEQIEQVVRDMDRFGAPADIALWDTEVNFNVDAPGGAPSGRIAGTQAAAWATQAYLEGWRLGVRRTYWYLWTADYYGFPGIQMRAGDPATRGLQVLGEWVIGSAFVGCEATDETRICTFVRSDGTEFVIAWSNARGGATIPAPEGSSVCPVDGSPCRTQAGDVPLTELPVRIG